MKEDVAIWNELSITEEGAQEDRLGEKNHIIEKNEMQVFHFYRFLIVFSKESPASPKKQVHYLFFDRNIAI